MLSVAVERIATAPTLDVTKEGCMMKFLTILICMAFLSGCAVRIPMQELEAEALRSGDWSQVEKRERLIAKRKRSGQIKCPRDSVAICDSRGSHTRCECTSRTSMESMLYGRRW